jgi:hypothetical protein
MNRPEPKSPLTVEEKAKFLRLQTLEKDLLARLDAVRDRMNAILDVAFQRGAAQ